MGLKTKPAYIDSIRQMKPTAYMFGEKIDSVVDNPRLRASIEATAATYELAQMDQYRDLLVTHSPLIDEPVNRFTLPPGSIEDLVARVKINRTLGNWVGTCHQRCTGLDCLAALSIVAYDIDQKKYLKGKEGIPVENRIKMFRLVEKMAMESADTISDIHGGGSPEAHRVTILRETNVEAKKKAAKRLAGIDEG